MSQERVADVGRREKWADQENRKRHEAFQNLDLAWSREDQVLEWMIGTTRAGSVASHVADPSGFALKRGEVALDFVGACRLIEVKRAPGGHVQAGAGLSVRVSRALTVHVGGTKGAVVPGAESLQIGDAGEALVSNKRVLFRGAQNSREWTFSKLISMDHDPERPITLLHVSNRQKVSGIVYAPEDAPRVRFALELGLALETGDRDGLLARLESERAAHLASRPSPPEWVTPADAPSGGRRAGATAVALLTGKPGQSRRRRGVHTAISAVVLLTVFNGISGAMGGGSGALVAEVAPTRQAGGGAASTQAPAAAPVPGPATPTLLPDAPKKIVVPASPKPPTLLSTTAPKVRVGATCRDGSHSDATGSGACSRHGGVASWLLGDSPQVAENKAVNSERIAAYEAKRKTWNAATKKKNLVAKYPCAEGPYPEGEPGYAAWRDTNHNGVACDQ